jgi:hypothetical protein
MAVYSHQHYLANKERYRANNKRWLKEHPDHNKARYLRNAGKLTAKYSLLCAHAKKRKLDVTISFEEYCEVVSHPCYYCGGNLPVTGHGLDRINSQAGYVSGNIRPCCQQCNRAKSSMTENEFKEWILKVMNKWVSCG